jgi:hypothetical protein
MPVSHVSQSCLACHRQRGGSVGVTTPLCMALSPCDVYQNVFRFQISRPVHVLSATTTVLSVSPRPVHVLSATTTVLSVSPRPVHVLSATTTVLSVSPRPVHVLSATPTVLTVSPRTRTTLHNNTILLTSCTADTLLLPSPLPPSNPSMLAWIRLF